MKPWATIGFIVPGDTDAEAWAEADKMFGANLDLVDVTVTGGKFAVTDLMALDEWMASIG